MATVKLTDKDSVSALSDGSTLVGVVDGAVKQVPASLITDANAETLEKINESLTTFGVALEYDSVSNELTMVNSEGTQLGEAVSIESGLSFSYWEYDDEYYLHLYDADGNDVIDPVYIPGGGGTSSGDSYSVRLVNQSGSLSRTVSSSASTVLSVMFYETYSGEQTSGEGQLVVEYKLSSDSSYTQLSSQSIAQGVAVSIDVTEILTTGKVTNVRLTVTGDESALSKSLTYTISSVEAYIASLSSAFPDDDLSASVFTGNTTLSYKCVGSGLSKVVYFYIDDALYDSVDVGTSHNKTLTENLTLTNYGYGAHDLKYYFITSDGTQSNVLHNIILYDNGADTVPVISALTDESVTYGDTITVKFVVYTPGQEKTDELNIRLYAIVDGAEVEYAASSLSDVENQVQKTWTCTEYPGSGTVYIELTSGDTTVTLETEIEELETEYEITEVESGLVYSFTASGRSNDDADKAEYGCAYTDSNETKTTIKAVNSGFNWVSNGYVSTDYGMALRFSGGASQTIQIPIFSTSYTDSDGQTVKLDSATGATVTTNGRTIELDIMSSNVTDRTATLISCMSGTNVGFAVTPHTCYLTSTNGAKITLDSTGFIENEESLSCAYLQPEKKIHITFVIEAAASNGTQCVNIYLNGRLSNSQPYDSTDSFAQSEYITISTDSCILDLFNVKLYNRALTEAEARQNYIAAQTTIAERLAAADSAVTLTFSQAIYAAVRYGDSSSVYKTNGKIAAGESTTIYNTDQLGHSDTVYIPGASVLTDAGDLSVFKPYEFQCNRAVKLQVLNIGSNASGYENSSLSSLDVSANVLLKELNIMNCTAMEGTLDLTGNGLIEEVYTDGSSVPFVSLPNGGVLRVLHLNAPTTITVRNQTLLEEFVCTSYGNLTTLWVDGTPNIPTDEILLGYADQLANVRLTDVSWELDDTELLELLVSSAMQGKYINSSGVNSDVATDYPYISGTVSVASIGSSLLAELNEIYPYLTIEYTAVVTQYAVNFVNWDGTVLNTQYINAGSAAADPVTTGLIDTPTRETDESYSYEYSGWDKTFASILANTTVTATYTATVRIYTVTWVNIDGTVLETQTCSYGAELEYSGDEPTYTAYESSYVFYRFCGWDSCTGCITEDLTVTAQYVSSSTHDSKDSTEMNAADVSYYVKTGTCADKFELKDRIPMTLGYLPDFANIAHKDFVDGETYFDGATVVNTGEAPLAEDSTWTFVVDAMFYDTTAGQALVSCYDESSYNGIQFRYSSGLSVRYGANAATTGRTTYRDLIVARHTKGNAYVTVYLCKPSADSYGKNTVTKTSIAITSAPLTLGAAIDESGQITSYANGVIYTCRLYYGDIGDREAKKIAQFTHEENYLEVAYQGGAYSDTDGNDTNLDFIFAASLSCVHQMNTTATNEGGWEATALRAWLQDRVFNALPTEWQGLVKTIITKQVETSSTDTDGEEVLAIDVQQTEDTLTLANYFEVSNSQSDPWAGLGKYIAYFTSNANRLAFRDIVIPDDAQFISYGTDPTEDSDFDVQEGDIWINTSDSSRGYIYHNGQWISASGWWLRDSSTANTTHFALVYNFGNANSSGNTATSSYAIRPRFSI
ncbi:MAG: DUF6273 domain-containing protein [Oscillospiraceae bacterium]|nr:DUF6273 domain-containing protein [Oscillospiraceae bacterium]